MDEITEAAPAEAAAPEVMPAEQPAAAAPAAPSGTDALVDGWFSERFHDSVVSQTTEIINFVIAAKEDLKRRLNQHQE